MIQTRMPVLYDTLTGEITGNVQSARRKALEDVQIAQHNRQTQAAHKAWKKARALTHLALEVGR